MNTDNKINTTDIHDSIRSMLKSTLVNHGLEDIAADLDNIQRLRVEADRMLTEARSINVKELYDGHKDARASLYSKVHGHIKAAIGESMLKTIFDGTNSENTSEAEGFKKALFDLEQATISMLKLNDKYADVCSRLAHADEMKAQRDALRESAKELRAEANEIAMKYGWDIIE